MFHGGFQRLDRITAYTGAWNAAVWYKVSYRTNVND
jgi:hypothetical protein